MKASELVALLNAEIEKYGDLEVRYHNVLGLDVTPSLIITYNEDGSVPKECEIATEIYIH